MNKEKTMTNIPDYSGDRFAAQMLANRITNYWRKRGYYKLRFWVEEDRNEERETSLFSIRSNVKFDANKAWSDLAQSS